MRRLYSLLLSVAPAGPARAAYLAALALVVIQVGIGIVMKLSQTGESYSFSPSGSITISEFCKFLLSTLFFYRECRTRASEGKPPSQIGGTGFAYSSLTTFGLLSTDSSHNDQQESYDDEESGPTYNESVKNPVRHAAFDMKLFWAYIQGEVSPEVRWGFCNLALFYVLINNSIFVSYKLADPGTIQLVKSGVTVITALVMMMTLGTEVSQTQWIAIIVQICGLAVTQYNPGTGAAYPIGTYIILLFQVFLSALSGVYNQALLKTDDSSLHADNMILYAAGTGVNFVIHMLIRVLKADEPSFFAGYTSFGAVMVIVNNIFIGLAITAVYKYADAVIKCFATAIGTGILLYLSPILFGTMLTFLALPGTIIVFAASWLYISNPPARKNLPTDSTPAKPAPSMFTRFSSRSKLSPMTMRSLSLITTIIIVAFLTMFDAKIPNLTTGANKSGYVHIPRKANASPFRDTVAMIRWNSPRQERIPLLQKYDPFFHTVHISMPDSLHNKVPLSHNLTNDEAGFTFDIYVQVAFTMQLMLDQYPEIDGLLYFHFDGWFDPLKFQNEDRSNMWVAASDTSLPKFKCMTDRKDYMWTGFLDTEDRWDRVAVAATDLIRSLDVGYKITPGEFCVGWSDIYHIPRRFFRDYIFLSEIFRRFGLWHEVAVPMIMHIIDQTRRQNESVTVLDKITDCWGDCCASNPTLEDVLERRCGHRMDLLNENITNAYYEKLDRQAKEIKLYEDGPQLGDPLFDYRRPMGNDKLKKAAQAAIDSLEFHVKIPQDISVGVDKYLASGAMGKGA